MAAVVALDLSRGGLRGVQVEAPYTARPKLTRFAAVEVPEGTIFDGEIIDQRRATVAIKQLWKAGGFTTNKVVFGVSNRKVVVREVTLPAFTGPRRKTSLRFAVEGQVPIDLDDAILDFLPLRGVDGGYRTAVDQQVHTCDETGVVSQQERCRVGDISRRAHALGT